jgi:glycosyltransferase involved in cell wall biosynthesis
MEARKHDVQLVIFGDDGSEFGPDVRAIGTLSDEISLATLYAAADVMVVPSRQDNLPNTVVESLACGTPVVGFNIGGMSDMVSHKEHGYLVRPFDEIDLADGINWVLSDEERHFELSRKARAKAESHYDVNLAAENYWQFFQQEMEKHS